VSQDLRMAIQQARQAKKLTQKELANQLMIQASVINDYESGRAVPNPQLISKLERALGCVGGYCAPIAQNAAHPSPTHPPSPRPSRVRLPRPPKK
jgi:transcriptional regulator with XRE-family HTH domain